MADWSKVLGDSQEEPQGMSSEEILVAFDYLITKQTLSDVAVARRGQ